MSVVKENTPGVGQRDLPDGTTGDFSKVQQENFTTLSPAKLALEYSRGNHQQKNEVLNRLQDATPTIQREFWDYANNPADIPDVETPVYSRFILIPSWKALEDRPIRRGILGDLIWRATINMLVGDAGTKKTYLAIFLNVYMAIQKTFLEFETEQVKCLYIDEEMGEDYILDRFGEVYKGMPEVDPKSVQVDIISNAGFNLLDPVDQLLLEEIITSGGYGLVTLDAFADLIPGADENSSKDMTPVFLFLRRIAAKTNCSFLLLHHTTKSTGLYRGSTDIKSKVDLMLTVQSGENSPKVTFKTDKVRHGRPRQFAGEVTWRDGAVYLSESEGGSGPVFSKAERYVLRFLSDKENASVSDIMNNADTCTDKSARAAVYSLADKGFIARVNVGQKGAAAFYSLTSSGKEVSCQM